MKLTNHEKTLITVLAVNGPAGQPVSVPALECFFERPVFLRQAVASLARWQLITHDPFKAEVRLLAGPVLRALCVKPATQGLLFGEERPLDAGLAEVNQVRSGISGEQVAASPALRRPDCTEPVPANKAGVPEHVPRAPGHGVCVPAHAHVNVTSNREDVPTIKRNVGLPAGEFERLRAAVLAFVGGEDFAAHWDGAGFWRCEVRRKILARTLRFVTGGPKTRTTPGRHLWAQFKIDCGQKGLEAVVRV